MASRISAAPMSIQMRGAASCLSAKYPKSGASHSRQYGRDMPGSSLPTNSLARLKSDLNYCNRALSRPFPFYSSTLLVRRSSVGILLAQKQTSRLSYSKYRPLSSLPVSSMVTGAPLGTGLGKDAPGSALGFSVRKRTPGDCSREQIERSGVGRRKGLNRAERGRAKAGKTDPGDTSSAEQSPGESTEPPLPNVSLNLSGNTVALAVYAVGVSALSCAMLPPLKLSRLPLAGAAFFHILLAACAMVFVCKPSKKIRL